jgi:hypothetical protein
MKILLLLSAGLVLVLAGCGKSSDDSTPVSTAPVDYLKSATDSKHSADKTVDTAALIKAVDMFNVQEGRFPKDLDELVAKKYIPQIPTPPFGSKIEYDAKTGTVKVVKQ